MMNTFSRSCSICIDSRVVLTEIHVYPEGERERERGRATTQGWGQSGESLNRLFKVPNFSQGHLLHGW